MFQFFWIKSPSKKKKTLISKGKTFYLAEEVADAPEAVGEAGLLLAQPVVVGDAHEVRALQELLLLGHKQLLQPFWARLLHAFKNKLLAREKISTKSTKGSFPKWDREKHVQKIILILTPPYLQKQTGGKGENQHQN